MKKLSLVSVVVIMLLASCDKHEIVNQDELSPNVQDVLLYDFDLSSSDSEASWNEEAQTILLTDTVTGNALGVDGLTFKVKSMQKPIVEFVYEYDNKGLSVEGKMPKVDITSTYNGTVKAGDATYSYLSDVTITSIPTQIEERQVPLDIHMILKDASDQVKDTITFQYRPKYDNTDFAPVRLYHKFGKRDYVYWAPINIGAKAITGHGSEGNDSMKQNKSNPWNVGAESDPIKSKSDPCPAGWRIPTIAEWREIGVASFDPWWHDMHILFQSVPYFTLKTNLFSGKLILPMYDPDDYDDDISNQEDSESEKAIPLELFEGCYVSSTQDYYVELFYAFLSNLTRVREIKITYGGYKDVAYARCIQE